jgi:hypothetical protein
MVGTGCPEICQKTDEEGVEFQLHGENAGANAKGGDEGGEDRQDRRVHFFSLVTLEVPP